MGGGGGLPPILSKKRCKRDYDCYVPPYDRAKAKESNVIKPKKFNTEDVLALILIRVEGTDKMVRDLKGDFFVLSQTEVSHSASIKKL